ncbi:MAG: hypothetical protein ACRETB_04755 [Steroidobacteraceae bacterium]
MRTALAAAISLAGLVWVGQSPAIARQRSYAEVFGPLLKRADCDDSCLRKSMSQYLEALVAHDPSRLPLAQGVKFTENTNEMAVGGGLWRTIGGVLPQRIIITDPTTAQVESYGAVLENGRTSLLYVRLEERAGLITQIETVVVRKPVGNFGTFAGLQGPLSDWSEILAPAQRRSRQELIALVNQYFEGIEQSNGNIVPFDPNCERWENNLHTSGGSSGKPAATPSGARASNTGSGAAANTARSITKGMTIGETFNTHVFSYITHITDRRFPVVDVKRGIVTAIVMFQHPGNIRYVDVPGYGRVKLTGVTSAFPNTTEIVESFRVKNGRIVGIFAYVSLLPYHQRPGW